MPASTQSVISLADAHARSRARVESRVLRLIRALLTGMRGHWYSDSAVADFKAQAIEIVGEAQQTLGGVTAEFLDQVLAEIGLAAPRNPFKMPGQIRKVDPMVEWERPAEQYRYAKSVGADDQSAEQAALVRAEALTVDDVALAQSVATITRLQDYPAVTGYRRIIHPELSKSGTCGLCAVASDRVYKTDRLLPVHDHCHCGVLPIAGKWDPGSQLNGDDLARLYKEAGSTAAEDLKRTRFTVVEHSELGPRLVAA